jgi:hypothetical protein
MPAVPSNASSSCAACRTGENDRLPSGVVGAVDGLSSESAIAENALDMIVKSCPEK